MKDATVIRSVRRPVDVSFQLEHVLLTDELNVVHRLSRRIKVERLEITLDAFSRQNRLVVAHS